MLYNTNINLNKTNNSLRTNKSINSLINNNSLNYKKKLTSNNGSGNSTLRNSYNNLLISNKNNNKFLSNLICITNINSSNFNRNKLFQEKFLNNSKSKSKSKSKNKLKKTTNRNSPYKLVYLKKNKSVSSSKKAEVNPIININNFIKNINNNYFNIKKGTNSNRSFLYGKNNISSNNERKKNYMYHNIYFSKKDKPISLSSFNYMKNIKTDIKNKNNNLSLRQYIANSQISKKKNIFTLKYNINMKKNIFSNKIKKFFKNYSIKINDINSNSNQLDIKKNKKLINLNKSGNINHTENNESFKTFSGRPFRVKSSFCQNNSENIYDLNNNSKDKNNKKSKKRNIIKNIKNDNNSLKNLNNEIIYIFKIFKKIFENSFHCNLNEIKNKNRFRNKNIYLSNNKSIKIKNYNNIFLINENKYKKSKAKEEYQIKMDNIKDRLDSLLKIYLYINCKNKITKEKSVNNIINKMI